MENGKGSIATLDTGQLNALLVKVAADYALNLREPQGLQAALMVVNALLQLESTRLLTGLDSRI